MQVALYNFPRFGDMFELIHYLSSEYGREYEECLLPCMKQIAEEMWNSSSYRSPHIDQIRPQHHLEIIVACSDDMLKTCLDYCKFPPGFRQPGYVFYPGQAPKIQMNTRSNADEHEPLALPNVGPLTGILIAMMMGQSIVMDYIEFFAKASLISLAASLVLAPPALFGATVLVPSAPTFSPAPAAVPALLKRIFAN